MKSNKELVLDFVKGYVEEHDTGVSTLYLAEQLNLQRTNISSILNQLVSEGEIEKVNGRPVLYIVAEKNVSEQNSFSNLIGYDSSLKNAVQLAQAAVLYPKRSLDALIVGPSGSGKSYFAWLMYQFAMQKKVLDQDAPFIKVNCKNYVNDEDTLIHDLFHTSDSEFTNYFDQGNKGILFIDNISLLPATARNILFQYIESGEYTSSDSNKKTKVNTILICACNDDINKIMLENYIQKFPIKISLPALAERTMEERFELIQRFFTIESARVGKVLKINSELLRCLMLYECTFNVKQLRNDIQIGCANAFVREYGSTELSLTVYISDFEHYVRKGFLNYKKYRNEIERIIPENYSYSFTNESMEISEIVQSEIQRANIYEEITIRAEELARRGIDEKEIGLLMSIDVDQLFKRYQKYLAKEIVNTEQLSKLVDQQIIDLVARFLQDASLQFKTEYSPSIFYGLCLHLNGIIDRIKRGQSIPAKQIMDVVEQYKEEYAFTLTFAKKIEKVLEVQLPIDEVVLMTMFICDKYQRDETKSEPVILIVMHGDNTATSIALMVNTLVQANNVYGFDISLDEATEVSYQKLQEKIQKIHQGKGVIVLYDMGSIREMCRMIYEETNIELRLLKVPMTQVALEYSRKATMVENIDELYHGIADYMAIDAKQYLDIMNVKRPKAIITLCNTGDGGALQLKNYLEDHIDFGENVVIPLAISDRNELQKEIQEIQKKYRVHCLIGTINPQIGNYPFIPISKIFEVDSSDLSRLLEFEHVKEKGVDYNEIYEYLDENLEYVDIEKVRKVLPQVMHDIKKSVDYELSQDQELGLFVHIACSINRILANEKLPENKQKEVIMKKYKKLFKETLKTYQKIEKAFGIIFSDDEIANVVAIIKKL